MVGFHSSAAWAGRGFPLCLSGMAISSRSSFCHPQLLQRISLEETEFSSPSEHPVEPVFNDSRLCENENQSTATTESEEDETIQIQPRLALTLEMAEHEHRRDAIRSQRSNDLADDSNSSVQRDSIGLQDLMQAIMEDPSLEIKLDKSVYGCAKAA